MLEQYNVEIFEHLSDAVLFIDSEKTKIIYGNVMANSLLGIDDGTIGSIDLEQVFLGIKDYDMQNKVVIQELETEGTCVLEHIEVKAVSGTTYDATIVVGYVNPEKSIVYLILKNMDDKTKLLNALVAEQSFFEAVQSFSSDLIFRVNLSTKEVQYIGRSRETFNVPPQIENYPESIISMGVICEGDVDIFRQMAARMYAGQDGEEYFRALDKYNIMNWYRTEYIICRNIDGIPVEAIGKITNAQQQMELEQRLQIDSLTGCLTKAAFERLTADLLVEGTHHTLFIIDIDNFKTVNDNLGHQFGDVVLHEIGSYLNGAFRKDDYVGRIGGDEFMVCLKDVEDNYTIVKKAQQVLKLLDKKYAGKSKIFPVTGSIGIAKFPEDGNDFQTIYNHADIALYECKHKGKNNYKFFNTNYLKGTMINSSPFDMAMKSLSQHFDMELVTDVFYMLYASVDPTSAMQKVVERLGEGFAASRCYIVELNTESAEYYNSYEWCAQGVEQKQESLQEISVEFVNFFSKLANADGIFYCNDMETFADEKIIDFMNLQKVESFLHAYIKQDDNVMFMVGFDDCRTSRKWSPIIISTLLFASKMMAQFLELQK